MRSGTRWSLAAMVAFGSWACGESEPDGAEVQVVDEMKAALPSAEQMTINVPTGNFLVGEQATFYAFTRNVSLGVNGFVRNISNVVEDITELPPSETDGATYAVWGPYNEALSPATWRLRVDVASPGVFDYRVEGWPRDEGPEAALVVLSGHHEDGAGPRRGVGTWTYNLTNGHTLEPLAHDSIGEVSVDYDLGDARALEVHFTDVQGPQAANATTALYRYTEAADRSGTFDYIANLDIHADDNPELDRRELLQVRSRWLATGPGRADVYASHGDLPAGSEAQVSECWGEAFDQTYVRWEVGEQVHEDGDREACPYADVVRPDFEGFDADAFAEGEMLQALPAPEDFAPDGVDVADPAAEQATYYILARDTVVGLRTHTRTVLNWIRDITRHPPSSCGPQRCVWGPWTDWDTRITTRLVIRRVDEGRFQYELSVKRFGAPAADWQTMISGGYRAGAGQGWVAYDIDVQRACDERDEAGGTFRAEYARAEGRHQLAVRFETAAPEDDALLLTARYFVDSGPDGGSLDLAVPADVDNGDAERAARELIEGRVRWTRGGAGVGDLKVTGGDVPEGFMGLGTECWDERGARTHGDSLQQPLDGERRPTHPEPCVFDGWEDAHLPLMGDEL